jgi:SAM-dependent methyltransferase
LPTRWGPLAFLFPSDHKPTFNNDRVAVTREAADALAACFKRLIRPDRLPPVPRPMAQRFTLQMLVALFAEDIGLLEKYFVTNLLNECHSPTDTYDLIGGLFAAMNSREAAHGGRFKDIPYFNGGLFADPARLELHDQELVLLRKAADFNWTKVQPEIFGTLFQHSMGDEERHAFGAHFTHPADIMKIVGPTIVQPWREQIDAAKTLKRLIELRDRLHNFRVLDPACGSGNFLYLAYRELKRLEAHLLERMQEFPSRAEPGQRMLSFLSAQNFYGLDIQPFAVEIAKVTMMIARKLAIDELHITEPALPLDNLDQNFIAADALITPDGQPAQWPKADVIIGNPPFLGAKLLKPERGPDYVNALRHAYADVPGMADYCVYWFRKAHDHLPQCTAEDPIAGRAGLVGTQNIRNNQSRVGGLDYVAKSGTIVEAVDNQPWSGEAKVHVSIANWAKTRDGALLPKSRHLWFKAQPTPALRKSLGQKADGSAAKHYELDFRECEFINSGLSDQTDVSAARALACNTEPQRCFNGQMLGHEGFLLSNDQRDEIVRGDAKSKEIIFPYLNGVDALTGAGLDRFVIDFEQRNQLQAAAFPRAFDWVRTHVLPDRVRKATEGIDKDGKVRPHHKAFLARWWQLSFGRPEMLSVIKPLPRYLACAYVTKRPIFMFISSRIRPSNLIQVFGFADDYSFGVLQSHAHWLWFITKCGKLKSDFRYSAESVFDTFPWPQEPQAKQVLAVAEAGREVRRVRTEALAEMTGGLRALYRTLEFSGANPLKDAHAALDAAILAAYGFSAKKDLLAQLLALNLEVAAKIEKGETIRAPGVPTNSPDAQKVVTQDCMVPVK